MRNKLLLALLFLLGAVLPASAQHPSDATNEPMTLLLYSDEDISPHLLHAYDERGLYRRDPSTGIALHVRRKRTQGGAATLDLIITRDSAEQQGREKRRLRIEMEDGDLLAGRVIPPGSTIQVLNLPFTEWGGRICVRFLTLADIVLGERTCTPPVEALGQIRGRLDVSDPLFWRADLDQPSHHEITARALFDPAREAMGFTLELYPSTPEVWLAVSLRLISSEGKTVLKKTYLDRGTFSAGVTPVLDVQLSRSDLPEGIYRIYLEVIDAVSGHSYALEEQIKVRKGAPRRSLSRI